MRRGLGRQSWRRSALWLAAFCLTILGVHSAAHRRRTMLFLAQETALDGSNTAIFPTLRLATTLVLYTYSNTDPEYESNLRYFVKHGVAADDDCEYVIIVQQVAPSTGQYTQALQLPKLPPNARYIFHENRCYDWGSFGWAMETGKVHIAAYRYFIFMNSSVRGPFLPTYWPEERHWSGIFTSKINDKVKLVGSTISCEAPDQVVTLTHELRDNAHVQSYLVATDQAGLEVLRADRNVFACYSNIQDTVYWSELGTSLAIFRAGYSIDSLMLRYTGVDWLDRANHKCNARQNPYKEFGNDGIALNPLEVVFVKVKGFMLDGDWAMAQAAATYAHWVDSKAEPGKLLSSRYAVKREWGDFWKAVNLFLRGSACFDFNYYRRWNKDLQSGDDRSLWMHFVAWGEFEQRPYRFTCTSPLSNVAFAWQVLEGHIIHSFQPEAGSTTTLFGRV